MRQESLLNLRQLVLDQTNKRIFFAIDCASNMPPAEKPGPARNRRGRFCVTAVVFVLCVTHAYAQDQRNVTEPRIPQSCATLTASLRSSMVKLYKAGTLPVSARGKVKLRKLLPDVIAGFEIDRMEFPGGAYMAGIPHTPGTREYLTCESGAVQLSVGGESWDLAPGDVLVFRGDQKHGYRNSGAQTAVAYSVVALAPAAN